MYYRRWFFIEGTLQRCTFNSESIVNNDNLDLFPIVQERLYVVEFYILHLSTYISHLPILVGFLHSHQHSDQRILSRAVRVQVWLLIVHEWRWRVYWIHTCLAYWYLFVLTWKQEERMWCLTWKKTKRRVKQTLCVIICVY